MEVTRIYKQKKAKNRTEDLLQPWCKKVICTAYSRRAVWRVWTIKQIWLWSEISWIVTYVPLHLDLGKESKSLYEIYSRFFFFLCGMGNKRGWKTENDIILFVGIFFLLILFYAFNIGCIYITTSKVVLRECHPNRLPDGITKNIGSETELWAFEIELDNGQNYRSHYSPAQFQQQTFNI